MANPCFGLSCDHIVGYDVANFEVEILESSTLAEHVVRTGKPRITWFSYCPSCSAKLSEGRAV